MIENSEKKRVLKWSNTHRIVPSSAFGLRANDNVIGVEFGTEQSVDDEEVILSEVQIVMTPRSVKTLILILQSVISKIEEIGGEIPIVPGQAEKIASDLEMNVQKK